MNMLWRLSVSTSKGFKQLETKVLSSYKNTSRPYIFIQSLLSEELLFSHQPQLSAACPPQRSASLLFLSITLGSLNQGADSSRDYKPHIMKVNLLLVTVHSDHVNRDKMKQSVLRPSEAQRCACMAVFVQNLHLLPHCPVQYILTYSTLCITVWGLVNWGGVGCAVSIDNMTKSRAAGVGRDLTICTTGGWTGTWPRSQVCAIHCALGGNT